MARRSNYFTFKGQSNARKTEMNTETHAGAKTGANAAAKTGQKPIHQLGILNLMPFHIRSSSCSSSCPVADTGGIPRVPWNPPFI